MLSPNLAVRIMQSADIPLICDYWCNSSDEHLTGMGVDLKKMPSRGEITANLERQLRTPLEERFSFAVIWLVNNKPVGHCNCTGIQFGEEAMMHLHLWRSDLRHQGIGHRLVRQSISMFFDQLRLKRLISEPWAYNEAPNKTLQRIGFTLEKQYVTTPGSITKEQEVKRWVLAREAFSSQNRNQDDK